MQSITLTLPGERGPLSGIKGVSELFDGVVLARQAEYALLIQAVLFDEFCTLLDQDWHHVMPEPPLVRQCVHKTFSEDCGEAGMGIGSSEIPKICLSHSF